MASGLGADGIVAPASFLILHGYENHRPAGHWQRWLSLELTARGHDVRYPQLPDPDHPDLGAWRAAALANLATLTEGTVTVIAHSASAVMWLGLCQEGAAPAVDRVVLVAPPEASVMEGIAPVAGFAWRSRDPAVPVSLGAEEALVLLGDDDEFAPHGADYLRPLVDAPVVELPGAGHLTPASGYGPWPEMLAWCLGEPAFL